MNTKITKQEAETQQDTIDGIAFVLDVAPQRVKEGFRKATPENLRQIEDGADAMFLLFEVDPEIVSDDLKREVAYAVLEMAMGGKFPPSTDFSELADEIDFEVEAGSL